MTIMFHWMGKLVQIFTEICGILVYRIDRSHSVMSIATTATPASSGEVRECVRATQTVAKINHSINAMLNAWMNHKENQRRHLQIIGLGFLPWLMNGIWRALLSALMLDIVVWWGFTHELKRAKIDIGFDFFVLAFFEIFQWVYEILIACFLNNLDVN